MTSWKLMTLIALAGIGRVTLMGQSNPLMYSFSRYQQMKENTVVHVDWTSAGPVLNSARVETVVLDPSHPGTIYVGFGPGSLWKSINNGLTWQSIFENQPGVGIGDLAMGPSNPDILYLGTGVSLRKDRNFTMPGAGVFRSDDGGITWKHRGLADSWHIGEVVVHPHNPEMVYVTVMGKFWSPSQSMGVYKTIDGGLHWNRVLYVNDRTRADDIVIAPSAPNVLYASMWENDLQKPLSESVYGPNSAIYRSKDGGDTWLKCSAGLPQNSKIGRTGLAVSHSNPDKAYALIDNRNNKPGHAAEVYRTVDGGLTWNRTHQDSLMLFSVIGWYFTDIYVNPQNDEEIFALGVRVGHSKDGGKTFDLLEGDVTHLQPSPAQTLHLDHCEMWINPQNPQHLALGNDGGLYLSYDKGANWLHLNNIPAGEFYDIALDNRTPYTIYGGTQDDATVFGPAKERTNQEETWQYLWIDAWSGGDGCVTQADPDDPNTVYFSMQEGAIRRKNMATGKSIGISPRDVKEFNGLLKYNFITPYFISPHNSRTLYHGGNYLLKSTDRGDQWQMISRDLTQSQDTTKKSYSAGAIAESSLKPGLLYAGTDHGVFWTSKDDGAHWAENSKGLPKAYIRSISPSRHKEPRLYIAMTGINYDDLSTYLFVSEDYGNTWTSLAGNLPPEPANVILEDPVYENILYAGLHRGVYMSMDKGVSWSLMGNNFPPASVSDLEIQKKENDLVVATYGRGIFYVNLDPVHQWYSLGLPKDTLILFDIPDGKHPQHRDTHGDVEKTSVTTIPISFLAPENQKIQFQLTDQQSNIIWQKNFDAQKGLNQFRWDMIINSTQSNLPYFIHYQRYLPAGQYIFSIKTAEAEVAKNIRITGYL